MPNRGLNMLRILGLFVAVAITGCGPKPASLSGSIEFEGKPVELGIIALYPQANGKSARTVIEQGAFSIPESAGLVEGAYRIELGGDKMVKRKDPQEGPPLEAIDLFPDQYSLNSILTVTLQPGANRYDLKIDQNGVLP